MTDTSGTSKDRRRLGAAVTIIAVVMAAVALAGCGKKGAPIPPADEPNTYPQPYPRA